MRNIAVGAAAVALVLSGCSGAPTTVVDDTAPSSTAATSTTPTTTTTTPATTTTVPAATTAAPASTTTTSRAALWINVKYRPDPIDVAHPHFVYLDGGSSSLVDFAFYDAGNQYMIVSLDGTAYHHCGMPQLPWTQFTAASSLGSFYRDRIKGSYDCRSGVVPQY